MSGYWGGSSVSEASENRRRSGFKSPSMPTPIYTFLCGKNIRIFAIRLGQG